MELILEAQKLNSLISNISVDSNSVESVKKVLTTEKKVMMSLILADLTLDVNHVLGALIYLLESFRKDFNSFVYGGDAEEDKEEGKTDQIDRPISMLTLAELDL